MVFDIYSYLTRYVENVEAAVSEKVRIESSNSGLYQNSLGGTAYVSFYPNEVDLTLEIYDSEGEYELTADLTDQEGRFIVGDIFKIHGNAEHVKTKLDEIFYELVKLISDHL